MKPTAAITALALALAACGGGSEPLQGNPITDASVETNSNGGAGAIGTRDATTLPVSCGGGITACK